jgi:hypothetical protein
MGRQNRRLAWALDRIRIRKSEKCARGVAHRSVDDDDVNVAVFVSISELVAYPPSVPFRLAVHDPLCCFLSELQLLEVPQVGWVPEPKCECAISTRHQMIGYLHSFGLPPALCAFTSGDWGAARATPELSSAEFAIPTLDSEVRRNRQRNLEACVYANSRHCPAQLQ